MEYSPDTNRIKEVDVTLLRLTKEEMEKRRDSVAIEEPLHIIVNGEHYASILCSPSDMEALILGNVVSEGLIKSQDEIQEMQQGKGNEYRITLKEGIDISKRLQTSSSFKRLILTSCGSVKAWPLTKLIDRISIPRVTDPTKFSPGMVSERVRALNILASTFRKTGGVHAAALYDAQGNLTALAEDVGRHNAVDKVLGLALQQRLSFTATFLALTGRLTGDIVLKAARVKVPLVTSLAAAIDSGIEVAIKTGLTLVGFVRGDRMTIYTFPERLMP